MFEIIDGPASASKDAPYMGPSHLAYFEKVLLDQLEQLIERMQDGRMESAEVCSDPLDTASQASLANVSAREQAHINAQIREVKAAIARIHNNDYGYCEDTGEEIGFDRLCANPTARLCHDAQAKRELRQKHFKLAA